MDNKILLGLALVVGALTLGKKNASAGERQGSAGSQPARTPGGGMAGVATRFATGVGDGINGWYSPEAKGSGALIGGGVNAGPGNLGWNGDLPVEEIYPVGYFNQYFGA